VVRNYLAGMRSRLDEAGFSRDFSMLNSIGGVIPPEEASLKSIQLLSSGPAGGALAAQMLAKELGEPNVLTADMGGTSFDAGIIVDYEPLLKTEAVVGNLNLLSPMISIHSIGTGGGSIAESVDGRLKVGPQSAGSFPGPACYGRGGVKPTVTDANVVLGYLNPGYFLSGRMKLDRDASWAAIRDHVAEPLGMSVLDAAAGIREIADQHMADLLRQSTLERGYDPRDFCLFPFGGAGPVHASSIGREAGVRSILVPVTASVFSAQGILSADMRMGRQRSVLQRSAGDLKDRSRGFDGPALEAIFRELENEVASAAKRYGMVGEEQQFFRRSVGMRFARQVHEITISIEGALDGPTAMADLVAAFDSVYEQRFGKGTGSRAALIEITNCHLQLVRVLPKSPLSRRAGGPTPQPTGRRGVYLGEWIDVPVYDWDLLPAGTAFAGPALIDSPGTTVWVGASHHARVDQFGNLRLEAI
jgi:N-methylhydantoinase A